MSQQEIESLPIISGWGVPDWRDPSAYPDPEHMSLELWRWEFLRRCEDYRQDWLQYAMATYEKRKTDYEANPLYQCAVGFHESTGKPIIEERQKELPVPLIADFKSSAEMPGSEEEYGLQSLPHPANRQPENYPFLFIEPKRVEYIAGRGEGLSKYWGLEFTVFKHELVVRFDLTTKPARELMATLTEALPNSSESRQFLNLDEKVKGSILNGLRHLDGSPSPPKDKNNAPPEPRFLRDPQHRGIIYVIWDMRQPLGYQQKTVTTFLTRLQENLSEKPQARRARPSAWPNYLRVLDARAINPDTEEAYATYEDIGNTVYGGRGGYGSAKAQAKTAHKDALRLTTDFPT